MQTYHLNVNVAIADDFFALQLRLGCLEDLVVLVDYA